MEIVSNNIIGKKKKKQSTNSTTTFDIKKHSANGFFQMGDYIKNILTKLKNRIFLFRTTRPISTKLGTSLCKRNSSLFKWRARPFPRGDNKEIAKERFDIIICVYWFELFSNVSDVAHGPLIRNTLFVSIVCPIVPHLKKKQIWVI